MTTDVQNMHIKDGIANSERQQTCEGGTHHNGSIALGSSIKRQNNGHTRGHNESFMTKN